MIIIHHGCSRRSMFTAQLFVSEWPHFLEKRLKIICFQDPSFPESFGNDRSMWCYQNYLQPRDLMAPPPTTLRRGSKTRTPFFRTYFYCNIIRTKVLQYALSYFSVYGRSLKNNSQGFRKCFRNCRMSPWLAPRVQNPSCEICAPLFRRLLRRMHKLSSLSRYMAQSIPPSCTTRISVCVGNIFMKPTLEFLVYTVIWRDTRQGNIFEAIKMPFNNLPNYI